MARIDPNSIIRNYSELDKEKFEELVVMDLLKHYNMSKIKWDLLEAEETETREKKLRLHRFHEMFPSFPIFLISEAPTNLAKTCSVAALFTKFRTRPLFTTWENSRDRVHARFSSDYYGLVIKWPHLKYRVIFHNMGDNGTLGPKMLYRFKQRKTTLTMCLEPFKKFLTDLGWEPEYGREE